MAKQNKGRKFFATTATAALVATALTPAAFAAETTNFNDAGKIADWAKESVEYLVGKGALKGDTNGNFNPEGNLTRAEAATILVGALGLTVDESKKTSFDDAKDHWASEEIAALQAHNSKIISGYEDGTFRPNAQITRQELATIVVNAYGLKLDESAVVSFTDNNGWGKEYVSILASLGIVAGKTTTKFDPNAKVTRQEAAAFVHRTEVPEKRLEVESTTPKVTSVSAVNATQVQVKFNVEVDKTSAETVGNYKIDAATPATASLAADKKTVTLTFAAAANVEVSSKVLVVDKVALAKDSNSTTEVYTSVFSYKDTVKPEIVSLTSTTAGSKATSLTIKASEPILAATLKINGVSTPVNFGGTDTATVTGLSLDSNKAHTVEIINLTDKATTANINSYVSKSVTPVVDTVKPTVTLTAQSDKTILVTFSKSMNPATVTTALVNGSVKDESLSAVTSLTASAVSGTDNKQFTIDVTSSLFANTDTRTLYVVLPNSITDALGNKLDSTTQSVVLTKDKVKPAATGFSVEKDASGNVTKLVVEFSEGLSAKLAGAVADPTIIDENGVLVTNFLGGLTSGAVTKGDKKVVYTVTTPGKLTGTYTFNFSSNLVSDTAETANNSDAFTYNYNFGTGTTATNFNLNTVTQTGVNGSTNTNIITVDFGTAVVGGNVANSATALSNYTLNGQALPAGTTITLDAAREVATITIPSGTITADDAAAVFTATGIKSTGGALLNSTVKTVAVYDNTKPTLTAANVIGNTIYLTFDESLSASANDANIVDLLANYEIKSGTNTVVAGTGVATATVVPNSSNKQVAITFADTTGTNFDATQTITVETLNTGDLEDANGNSVKAGVKVTATK